VGGAGVPVPLVCPPQQSVASASAGRRLVRPASSIAHAARRLSALEFTEIPSG